MSKAPGNASVDGNIRLIESALRYGRVRHGVDISLPVAGFVGAIVEDLKNEPSLNDETRVFFYMLPLAMSDILPLKRYELMCHFQKLRLYGAVPSWLWAELYKAYHYYAPEGSDIEQEPFDDLDDR